MKPFAAFRVSSPSVSCGQVWSFVQATNARLFCSGSSGYGARRTFVSPLTRSYRSRTIRPRELRHRLGGSRSARTRAPGCGRPALRGRYRTARRTPVVRGERSARVGPGGGPAWSRSWAVAPVWRWARPSSGRSSISPQPITRGSGVGLAEESRGLEPSVDEVADPETDYTDRSCPPDGLAEAHQSARLPDPGLAEQPRLLFPLGPTDRAWPVPD